MTGHQEHLHNNQNILDILHITIIQIRKLIIPAQNGSHSQIPMLWICVKMWALALTEEEEMLNKCCWKD
jgi:hypothetical protein